MTGAGGDQTPVRLIGHVVVVAIEAAARDAVRRGERVELLQARVAHKVRPQPAVCRPARIVDQDLVYRVSLLGQHWVVNSLCVLAAVRALGADVSRVDV